MRRMGVGPDSTVYVLAKTTGADSHTSLGSTSASNTVSEDGSVTLMLTEDDSLTATEMTRAAAVAIASAADESFLVWRVTGKTPPIGAHGRSWSFEIQATGVIYPTGGFSYTFPFALA